MLWEGEMEVPFDPGGLQTFLGLWWLESQGWGRRQLALEAQNQRLPRVFFLNQCDFSAVRLLLTIRNILSQESAFSLQLSLLW